MSNERNQAVQAVVDRINSYQEDAPEGTVESELREGLAETGVDLDDAAVASLVQAIEGGTGPVSVDDVLG